MKVFANSGAEFNDLVVTNTDNPPEVSETHCIYIFSSSISSSLHPCFFAYPIQIVLPFNWSPNSRQFDEVYRCPMDAIYIKTEFLHKICAFFRLSSQDLIKKRRIWWQLSNCTERRQIQPTSTSSEFSGEKTTMPTWSPAGLKWSCIGLSRIMYKIWDILCFWLAVNNLLLPLSGNSWK